MVEKSNVAGEARSERVNTLFACLADTNRRRLLGFLYEHAPDSVTWRDLASNLAHADTAQKQRSNEAIQQALVDLTHVHLPKLEAAGLIEQDADVKVVATTDHPAYQDAGVVEVITTERTADSTSRDALFRSLSDRRRRTILDVLSHQFHPIHTETLAREVGAKELDTSEQEVPAEEAKQILGSLHHVHLPNLSNAGLIDYDADEGMVVYEGHPELRVPWMHSVLVPEFRESLTGESEPQELGVIEGRERVISYGQSLGERTEQELFCMFTHRDMLEMGCFTRIRNASRRGVNVYLGTFDETIREYVREHAPEIVLWEPNTDWLNLPVEGNKVGRLILSDREAVMLGTLKEETEGEVPDEKAIIGEGTDNTLVVMIRQMLSSHLERIDEQTDDVGPSLPF